MPSKEPRILLDAEILVKLAYLTISGDVGLRNLETLRVAYEQSNRIVGNDVSEKSLEITPLDELQKLCEQVLTSEDIVEE